MLFGDAFFYCQYLTLGESFDLDFTFHTDRADRRSVLRRLLRYWFLMDNREVVDSQRYKGNENRYFICSLTRGVNL